ncbi:MAG: hypothetical protein JEZ09_05930 [Salinivirgaceae bacterium]|nr:hypothetical protein [Salinivirgaceae bacterium]
MANVNISTIKSYGFSNTWILDEDFNMVYSVFDSTDFNSDLEISMETWANAFKDKGTCHFYLNVRDSILEIFDETIVPSVDYEHKTTAQGYFLAAKFWNKDFIYQMEAEMGFSISFRLPNDTLNIENKDDSKISVSKVLKDVLGNDIMIVDFTSNDQMAKDLSSTNKLSYVLITLLFITLFIFFFAVRCWISIPLTHITDSLNNGNSISVAALEGKKDEFGEIARLIERFFEQKKHLAVEIVERIESSKKHQVP